MKSLAAPWLFSCGTEPVSGLDANFFTAMLSIISFFSKLVSGNLVLTEF